MNTRNYDPNTAEAGKLYLAARQRQIGLNEANAKAKELSDAIGPTTPLIPAFLSLWFARMELVNVLPQMPKGQSLEDSLSSGLEGRAESTDPGEITKGL